MSRVYLLFFVIYVSPMIEGVVFVYMMLADSIGIGKGCRWEVPHGGF